MATRLSRCRCSSANTRRSGSSTDFKVDGSIPEAGAETALRALRSIDASLNNVQFDLKAVYTNDFVKKANAKYPKA